MISTYVVRWVNIIELWIHGLTTLNNYVPGVQLSHFISFMNPLSHLLVQLYTTHCYWE